MAKLIYSAICSLDLYVNDATGGFDWAAPDDEVHAFVNDQERGLGTYLLGRGMYEALKVWDTMRFEPDQPAVSREFTEIWQAADKVVYSATLDEVETKRTTLEREFDPSAVRTMVDEARSDMSVGGATLAGFALQAGIVDEVHLLLCPVVVGGGTRALPDDVRLDLVLRDTRHFESGVVYLRYTVAR